MTLEDFKPKFKPLRIDGRLRDELVYDKLEVDAYIENLFKDATIVYGDSGFVDWCKDRIKMDTHCALVIGQGPIKEESADDLLREISEFCDAAGIIEYKAQQSPRLGSFKSLLKRAKDYIERKGK